MNGEGEDNFAQFIAVKRVNMRGFIFIALFFVLVFTLGWIGFGIWVFLIGLAYTCMQTGYFLGKKIITR